LTDYENLISVAVGFRLEGDRIAIVTLIGNNGTSPRPIGSQMVVSEDGRSAGFLTGGCAENVIVDDTLAALAEGKNRYLRLGAGSPYIDVRLPCGAGIDLFIDTGVGDDVLNKLNDSIRSRVPVAIDTYLASQGDHCCVFEQNKALLPGTFRRWFYPKRRLLILGKGPNVLALNRVALASEHEVMVTSPDAATLAENEGVGAEVKMFSTPSGVSCTLVDPWTAAVLMFHEHEWEPELLETLLATDCFYIGALGSRRTHQQRLNVLTERGLAKVDDRLYGPVGIAIGAATPMEIAISVLAEVTDVYRQAARPLLVVGQIKQENSHASHPTAMPKKPISVKAAGAIRSHT